MAVRDLVVINTTGSNFETISGSDTVRIKGKFSVQNSSGNEVFGVDSNSVVISKPLTGSINISGSATSTGSFGRLDVTGFFGNASEISSILPGPDGALSSSAQIRSDISGSFNTISGDLSSSAVPKLNLISSGSVAGWNQNYSWRETAPLNHRNKSGTDLMIHGNANAAIACGYDHFSTTPELTSIKSQIKGKIRCACHDFGVQAAYVECFNGISWTELAKNLYDGAYGRVAGGTPSDLWYAGGYTQPTVNLCTEKFDGTAWSLSSGLSTGRRNGNGGGSSGNYGLYRGNNSANTFTSEEWDGSSWGHITNAPKATACNYDFFGGTYGIGTYGSSGGLTWNGSSWSEIAVHPLKTATYCAVPAGNGKNAGAGASSNAGVTITHTINPAQMELTATWDGTAWGVLSHNPSVGNGSKGPIKKGGTGTVDCAIFYGGYWSHGTPTSTLGNENSEGWSNASIWSTYSDFTGSFGRVEVNTLEGTGIDISGSITIPANAISSSQQLELEHYKSHAASRGNIGGIKVGAWTTQNQDVYQYTSNTTGPNLVVGTTRDMTCLAKIGDNSCCAEIIGGNWPAGTVTRYAWVNWDGIGWNFAGLNYYNGGSGGMAGTTNNALKAGGYDNPFGLPNQCTEHWNGINWTTVGPQVNSPGYITSFATTGTANDMKVIGGGNASNECCNTYDWDGTSWTKSTGVLNNAKNSIAYGTTNDTRVLTSATQIYNGTSWSTDVYMMSRLGSHGGHSIPRSTGGSNSAAMVAGCGDPFAHKTVKWNGIAFESMVEFTNKRTNTGATGDSSGTSFLVGGGRQSGKARCTELYYETALNDSTGSFGALEIVDTIKTQCMEITGSTFKLPIFNQNIKPTITKEGQIWYMSDENKLYFSVNSASLSSSISASVTQSFQIDTLVSASISGSY